MKAEKKIDGIMAALVVIGFILSLIPLLQLARYNHACADDYSYGIMAHQAWLETGSLGQTIAAAAEKVAERYQNWQGTFSSVFLMALQPAVFGEGLYRFTTYIMLFMLTISNAAFLKTLMRDFLKTSRSCFVIVCFGMLFVSVQTMLAPVEGLYWYNGSVHYVFMYSSLLLMLASLLKYLKGGRRRYIVPACLFAVIVGGGNFVTALTAILTVCIVGGFQFVYKQKKFAVTGGVLACSIISLAVSALAPGNAARQEMFDKPSILMAILYSFRDAVEFMIAQTDPLYLLFLIFIVPLIWKWLKQADISFKLPLLMPVVSFCLISAMFFPTEYSVGLAYLGRTGNVILFMIQLLGVLNEIYLLGWLAEKHRAGNYSRLVRIEKAGSRTVAAFFAVLIILAGVSVLVTYKSEEKYTSMYAFHSLRSGEALAYHEQIMQRLEVLENGVKEKVTFAPIEHRPYLLYFDDITDNRKDWRNRSMARFYGKKSVVISQP